VAQGTAAELKRTVGGERLDVVLADDAAFADALATLGRRAVLHDAAERLVGIATDGDAATVRALLDELDPDRRTVERFAVHAATLDDVFLTLTSSESKEPVHV
jgi:ABC-2 type transport system ATP-binding protein